MSKTIPIMEIFGPVIQGEGHLAGRSTFFVRTGGCDYRCGWCDTKYAVTPSLVKEHATQMLPHEIYAKLLSLGARQGDCITISGGNPVMHDLSEIVDCFVGNDLVVAVETQGTLWRDWVRDCDVVNVSPKPPSSGHIITADKVIEWLDKLFEGDNVPLHTCVKIVAFDVPDYDFASRIFKAIAKWIETNWSAPWDSQFSMYLQPGSGYKDTYTTGPMSNDLMRDCIANSYRDMANLLLTDEDLRQIVRIMPQVHTMVYGDMRGV
jgi:7-carboxy-7-deazaguanine synthase